MELVEIKDLFEMDYGAPSPVILADDSVLLVAFQADEGNILTASPEQDTANGTKIIVLKFKSCLKYTFGMPSNETIHGHPYSKLGMKSYSFYELRGSDLIQSLQEIDKVHPYYKAEKWQTYKHYILTLHDNMLECVAQGFEVKKENAAVYEQAGLLINKLSAM